MFFRIKLIESGFNCEIKRIKLKNMDRMLKMLLNIKLKRFGVRSNFMIFFSFLGIYFFYNM